MTASWPGWFAEAGLILGLVEEEDVVDGGAGLEGMGGVGGGVGGEEVVEEGAGAEGGLLAGGRWIGWWG